VTGVDASGNPIIKGGHGKIISIPFDDLSIVFPMVGAGRSPVDSGIDPGGNTIVSDLNGNLRLWTGPDGARDAYTYDAENRLRTATTASHTAAYDYDAVGRRISKTVDGVTTGYLLDGVEEVAEYNVSTAGVWPSSSARRYVTGPATDDRIAVVDSPSDTKNYYHINHQGSVIATTDLSGNIVQQLSYDEYGNLSSGSSSSTTGQVFRFTGQRYDVETGLYYYRARYYSSQLGRFLQTDSVGYKDDLNLYSYVGNDPLDRTDPTGDYGQGTGWTDDKWKKFKAIQQKTANDMEKQAGKLDKQADKLDAKEEGSGDKLRTAATNLRGGAAALRSDGSDGKVANAVDSKTYIALGGSAAGAAFAKGSVMTVNTGNDDAWKSGNTMSQWVVGHESLHTGARLPDLLFNNTKAYAFGSPDQRRAFDLANSVQDYGRPDSLMGLVYPGLVSH
jgi:RHS repeat-associated protein